MSGANVESPNDNSGRFKHLVMRYRKWRTKRHAKRLYKRLWKANDIVLVERHGAFVKQQNLPYWQELEDCADVITKAALATKRVFDSEPVLNNP